jgi:hypothetical protein
MGQGIGGNPLTAPSSAAARLAVDMTITRGSPTLIGTRAPETTPLLWKATLDAQCAYIFLRLRQKSFGLAIRRGLPFYSTLVQAPLRRMEGVAADSQSEPSNARTKAIRWWIQAGSEKTSAGRAFTPPGRDEGKKEIPIL